MIENEIYGFAWMPEGRLTTLGTHGRIVPVPGTRLWRAEPRDPRRLHSFHVTHDDAMYALRPVDVRWRCMCERCIREASTNLLGAL